MLLERGFIRFAKPVIGWVFFLFVIGKIEISPDMKVLLVSAALLAYLSIAALADLRQVTLEQILYYSKLNFHAQLGSNGNGELEKIVEETQLAIEREDKNLFDQIKLESGTSIFIILIDLLPWLVIAALALYLFK